MARQKVAKQGLECTKQGPGVSLCQSDMGAGDSCCPYQLDTGGLVVCAMLTPVTFAVTLQQCTSQAVVHIARFGFVRTVWYVQHKLPAQVSTTLGSPTTAEQYQPKLAMRHVPFISTFQDSLNFLNFKGSHLLTCPQVLILAIFFKKTSSTPGIDAAGLISAIVGLVLFLEGLRVAIMPMALLVGAQLPIRLKLPFVLSVAFILGVLVTYAEPAIAAIRPLAKLVDPQNAPYLYYLMNQQQELLVLAIGLGVGLASVVGTLKFLLGISIKPFIAGALLPTVGLACYMQW